MDRCENVQYYKMVPKQISVNSILNHYTSISIISGNQGEFWHSLHVCSNKVVHFQRFFPKIPFKEQATRHSIKPSVVSSFLRITATGSHLVWLSFSICFHGVVPHSFSLCSVLQLFAVHVLCLFSFNGFHCNNLLDCIVQFRMFLTCATLPRFLCFSFDQIDQWELEYGRALTCCQQVLRMYVATRYCGWKTHSGSRSLSSICTSFRFSLVNWEFKFRYTDYKTENVWNLQKVLCFPVFPWLAHTHTDPRSPLSPSPPPSHSPQSSLDEHEWGNIGNEVQTTRPQCGN